MSDFNKELVIDLFKQRDELRADNERLTRKVAELYEGAEEAKRRIQSLIAERDTARLQADQKVSLRYEFCQLLGTDELKEGVAAVKAMKDRIKRMEEALRSIVNQDYRNQQRIKRFEEAGDALVRGASWMGMRKEIERWREAKEAKP